MKLYATAILAACCLALSAMAQAESTPVHYCSKPYKPYKFTSEWEVSSFKRDVETYKRCIEDFVEEQNEAIRRHRSAANDAIGDWNRFLKFDLQ